MEEKYQVIKKIVELELACSAHDLEHVYRVYNFCIFLAKFEDNVDLDVLKTAALLHDIAKVREDRDNSGQTDHATLGAEMAGDILKKINYEKIDEVVHCIKTHRFKGQNRPESIEAKILFDSDKIDILGAIGIARSYMIAGQYKQTIFSNIPLEEYVKDNLVGGQIKGRIKEIAKHAPNLEFEIKIKNIPNTLFTEKGREIAKERIKFMQKFFNQLKEDIDGKNY